LFLVSCNNIHNKKLEVINKEITYSEKQFSLRWNIEKKSITNIPLKIKNKLKNICKDFDRYTLVKIRPDQRLFVKKNLKTRDDKIDSTLKLIEEIELINN
jgi:hypothetical protein